MTHRDGGEYIPPLQGRDTDLRGTRIAVVALARRLSRILYPIWRDDSVFRMPPVAA